MKTVYIPKGEVVTYESLITDQLVVKGCLKVTNGIKARIISGDGVICSGTVEADTIRIGSLEAAAVICKRLLAKRVQAPEVFASESAAVSCFLSAAYVETGRLTVAISEISTVKADQVVNLTGKQRTLFGTLLASALRVLWVCLTTSKTGSDVVMDADYVQVEEAESGRQTEAPTGAEKNATASSVQSVSEEIGLGDEEPADEELTRMISIFKLLRESGYTLKIIPGTPEENAPVFDFVAQTIQRPAAPAA